MRCLWPLHPIGCSLLVSTSAAVTLLVAGPSFPPRMQGPISMLPSMPIAFSGAPEEPVPPPAPYRAPGHRQRHTAPCRVPERRRALHYSLWQACRGLVSPRLMLVQLWPLQLGQCICLVTCLGTLHSRPLCKLSLQSLPGSAKAERPVSFKSNI